MTSSVKVPINRQGFQLEQETTMNQLRLAYSNSNEKTRLSKLPSTKFKMSRVTFSRLPRLAQRVVELQHSDPDAAAVIERLVDEALRRRAG
ncbi:MAG: hypothetical protein Q8T13_13730 [Acidobacteriota bacterium]|nr:hypothetical protein [Acidobacteriota bacterium]